VGGAAGSAAGNAGQGGQAQGGAGGDAAGSSGAGGDAAGAAGAGGDAAGSSGAGGAGAGGVGGSAGVGGGSGALSFAVDWTQRFGVEGPQSGERVAVDGQGSIFLAGSLRTAIDLGGGPITNETDGPFGETGPSGYFARFSEAGKHVYSHALGAGKGSLAHGIAAQAGALQIVGEFTGTIDLGKGPLTSGLDKADINNDAFLAGYTPDGLPSTAQTIGGSGPYAYAGGVAIDEGGLTVIAGQIQGTTKLGPTSPSVNEGEVYLAALKPDGSADYAWGIEGSRGVTVKGLVPRSGGGVLMVAELFGSATLGGQTFNAPPDKRLVVVAAFDKKGQHVWRSALLDVDRDLSATGVSVGPDGTVWATGYGTTLLPTDEYDADAFVISFDKDGKALTKNDYGGKGNQYAWSIAAHPDGGAVVVGSYENSLDQDKKTLLVSGGAQDAFLLFVGVEGLSRNAISWGGPDDQVALSVAISPAGLVAVTGYFSGTIDFGKGPLSSVGGPGNSDAFLLAGTFK
jgi:hypothetical protein